MSVQQPKLLSIAQAAVRLGVSRRTLERLVADGELPSILISPRRRLIDPRDLDTFVADRRYAAGLHEARR